MEFPLTKRKPQQAEQETITKPKRAWFQYDEDLEMMLVEAVKVCKAHIARYVQKASSFDNAHRFFVQLLQDSDKSRDILPSSKSVRDRYWNLEKGTRRINASNQRASGIEEIMTDLGIMLDEANWQREDFIREEEESKEKKINNNQNWKKLTEEYVLQH